MSDIFNTELAQKLNIEKINLNKQIYLLYCFIKSKHFGSLSKRQQKLIFKQYHTMRKCFNILWLRIVDLEEKSNGRRNKERKR